jgi:hypothetical protein
VFVRSYKVIEPYEVVFRNRDFTLQEMASHTGDRPAAFSENISVDVMATLNLLGESGRTVKGAKVDDEVLREEIMQKLQIVGFSKTGNRDNNESHVTIIIGGVVTVEWNGTQTGEPGDWAIVTAPSNTAVPHDATGRGGKDYAEEQVGGRVTLRLEPYRADIHMLTPQHVYACLSAWRADKRGTRQTYLQSYIDASLALQQSILRIVVAGASALVNTGLLAPAADALARAMPQALAAATPLQQLQHLLAGGAKENLGASQFQREIIDEVFAAYVDGRKQQIWRDRSRNNAASGIGQYMLATAHHVRIVLERVVGRLLHGVKPNTDVDLALLNPSH